MSQLTTLQIDRAVPNKAPDSPPTNEALEAYQRLRVGFVLLASLTVFLVSAALSVALLSFARY